jgi:hypothetical protein
MFGRLGEGETETLPGVETVQMANMRFQRSGGRFLPAGRLGGGLAGLCLLLAAVAVAAAPKVGIDPLEIDLGNVEEGQSFERFIEVTNLGDGVLVLEDVKASCGCTAVALAGVAELRQGDTERISITFNTKNLEGEVAKTVTVITSDPVQRQSTVVVKAKVHRPVRWTPSRVLFRELNPEDEFSQVVTLEADRTLGLEIRDARIIGGTLNGEPSETFSLETSAVERSGDRDFVEFTVTLNPDQPPQQVNEMLQVVTNLRAPRDTLRLSIRGELTGRLKLSRNFAILPMVTPGEEAVREIEITAREGTFRVLSAEVPDSPVEVAVHPDAEGTRVVLKLRYVGAEPGANGIKTLRVETDDSHQPLLELPVRYQTRAAPRAERAEAAASSRADGS